MAGSPKATEHGSSHRAEQTSDVRHSLEQDTRDAKEMIEDGAATTRRQAAAATEALRDTMENTHDVARVGMRAAAEVQGQVAELGQDQANRGIKAAARMAEIYRETADRTVQDVQALMVAASTLGHGAQKMQHAWLDLLSKSLDQAKRRPQELLRCGSPVEFAEAQRDLYQDGISYMVDATTTMLTMLGEMAQETNRSLQARPHKMRDGKAAAP